MRAPPCIQTCRQNSDRGSLPLAGAERIMHHGLCIQLLRLQLQRSNLLDRNDLSGPTTTTSRRPRRRRGLAVQISDTAAGTQAPTLSLVAPTVYLNNEGVRGVHAVSHKVPDGDVLVVVFRQGDSTRTKIGRQGTQTVCFSCSSCVRLSDLPSPAGQSTT